MARTQKKKKNHSITTMKTGEKFLILIHWRLFQVRFQRMERKICFMAVNKKKKGHSKENPKLNNRIVHRRPKVN